MARRGSKTLFTTSGGRASRPHDDELPEPGVVPETPEKLPTPPSEAPRPRPTRFGLAGWLCLAATIVLGTALALALLTNQSLNNQLDQEEREHQAAIEEINEREKDVDSITGAREATVAELGSLTAQLDSAQGIIEILKQEAESLRGDIAHRDDLLREFDQPYREQLEGVMTERDDAVAELTRISKEHRAALRQIALGSHLGLLTVGDVTYEGAIISSIDPAGFDITHEGGVARIDFGSLPPEDRPQYGFDRAEALEHHRKMAEDKAQQRALAEQRKVVAERQAAEQAAQAANVAAERRLDYSRNWIARLDLEIEELQKAMGKLGARSASRSRYLSMIEDKQELRARLADDLRAMEAGLR